MSRADIEPALLAALIGPPAHGYAISRRLRSAVDTDLPEGTVYPVLHRLERTGLVRSRWADVDGRRRRVYELTGAGAAAVADQAASRTAMAGRPMAGRAGWFGSRRHSLGWSG